MRYAWWIIAYCIMWCPRNYFWLFQMPKTTLNIAQILEFPQPNFEWTREKRCRYLEISKINRKELFFEFLKKNEVFLYNIIPTIGTGGLPDPAAFGCRFCRYIHTIVSWRHYCNKILSRCIVKILWKFTIFYKNC